MQHSSVQFRAASRHPSLDTEAKHFWKEPKKLPKRERWSRRLYRNEGPPPTHSHRIVQGTWSYKPHPPTTQLPHIRFHHVDLRDAPTLQDPGDEVCLYGEHPFLSPAEPIRQSRPSSLSSPSQSPSS